MTSPVDKAEKQAPFREPFCGAGGCGQGDFGRVLVNLEVPGRDVRTDGEIV